MCRALGSGDVLPSLDSWLAVELEAGLFVGSDKASGWERLVDSKSGWETSWLPHIYHAKAWAPVEPGGQQKDLGGHWVSPSSLGRAAFCPRLGHNTQIA